MITCSAPAEGNNTNPIPDDIKQNGMIYLQQYVYTCLEGYYTTDDVYTICKPDSFLSLTTPPTCNREFSY